MDFFSITVFLIIYYIRPQEWVDVLLDLPLVQYVMILALSSILLNHRGLQLRDIFKTPHDWLMLFYFLWVVFSAPTFNPAFAEMRNLVIFYLVIVQTLQTRATLQKFLLLWTWMILTVAILAVASEFGFDPMGSYDLTHGLAMKGRLCLNTSIFNNPNALAHGVIAAVPMLYFIYIWRRPPFVQETFGLLALLPIWCAYLTQSRGGYAAGIASLGSALLFGRNRILQILMVVGILAIGPPLLHSIRYMERSDDKGTEGSVQGRKTAFQFGLRVMKENRFKGLGYRQFTQHSPWIIEMRRGQKIKARRIAPHSAYNGIGAEQGKLGLLLWLGVFYCSMKTLVLRQCNTTEDERLRRLLLSANLAFMFSAFFIDIAYRATYFFTAAATAAFHRVIRLESTPDMPATSDAAAPVSDTAAMAPFWNRLGFLDIAGIAAATIAAIKMLEYMAVRM